jgi:hypothetical protein
MNILFYPIVIILLIFGDVLLFAQSSDIRIFAILFLYIFFVKKYRIKSTITYILALFFLFLAFIQFIFSNQNIFIDPGPASPISERMAVWVFLFMIIGIVHKWKSEP